MNIDDLFVAESHCGLGLGERLMLAARDICIGAGSHRLRWEVQPDNQSAIRFYEPLGARIRSKGVFSWDV
jgi:ribosomal protein S18 acetylase RimI-like enzyme